MRPLIKSKNAHFTHLKAAALTAALVVFVPVETDAADWEWTVAPYVWATEVGLDVAINDDPVIGASVSFKDLLKTVEATFMGHFEGQGETFGVFGDTLYLHSTKQTTTTVGPGGPLSGDVDVGVDLKMGIYELGGIYRFGNADTDNVEFNILLGARIIVADQTLEIMPPGPASTLITRNLDVSETDVLLGGRLLGKFNDKWGYNLRADVSRGGSDGTFNALAAAEYSFGETGLFSLNFGYRYMSIELKKESGGVTTDTELSLSGPFVGFVFRF
jgi:hypothetical protein